MSHFFFSLISLGFFSFFHFLADPGLELRGSDGACLTHKSYEYCVPLPLPQLSTHPPRPDTWGDTHTHSPHTHTQHGTLLAHLSRKRGLWVSGKSRWSIALGLSFIYDSIHTGVTCWVRLSKFTIPGCSLCPHLKIVLNPPFLDTFKWSLARFWDFNFESGWVFFFLPVLSPPEERKYKCHLCPYAAKCRANLNQHLTVHSVKLVSTDTEDIVSAVTSEGSDGKKHPYYYR